VSATRKAKTKKHKSDHVEKKHPVMNLLSQALAEGEQTVMLADGLEDALIGVSLTQPGRNETLAVYDYDKCAAVLVKRDGMSYEEAYEFLDFNTVGAWMGDETPVFLRTAKTIIEGAGLEMPKKEKKR